MHFKSGFLILALSTSACSEVDRSNNVEPGPLSESSSADIFGFDELAPLKNNKGDALRVMIQPSFGQYHYRFDFLPLKTGCKIVDPDIDDMTKFPSGNFCGNVLAHGVRTDVDAKSPPVAFRFVVPAEDFRLLFDSVKNAMARWTGNGGSSIDGTSVAVELHSRGNIKSFNSNALFSDQPGNPSARAGIIVKSIALAYGPAGIFPREYDWHVDVDSEQAYPCDYPGLAEFDPDGFGVGEDPCGRSLSGIIAKN